ncbi:hypothetical protein AK812_SmicGene9280 [Symbiodinium microadriaticum]|uniref:Uncharacterized protein n=1 Tax=Symbiodinium microadriaticum TaxID=2951 RepID=A0A1Q9EIS8_SYMMI|nr:hypothetical protein AK812_SmicGene9280 [Symbiodinium microadriaticum]
MRRTATSSEPRVLWSVVHNLALKKGMTFNRRFVISGFELPRTLGPNDRQQSEGKVTQQMVVNELAALRTPPGIMGRLHLAKATHGRWNADKPFMNSLTIHRWKARFPFWPPPDASPVTPIEPWGKQFFVYNAPENTELQGDPRAPSQEGVRPAWLRDEDAASMLRDDEALSRIGPKPKPQLLAARRAAHEKMKPGHGTRRGHEEWRALLAELPRLKEELRQRQAEVDALDEKGQHMQDYLLRRKYVVDKYAERRIGVLGYGEAKHNRMYFSGKMQIRARERRIRLANRVLEESNEMPPE